MALAVDRVKGGSDCAAPFVAHHHHERRLEMAEGVAQAPQHVGSDDVSGHADDEEVAEPLVEDQLRWNPGVAARQDGGERLLADGQMGTPVRRLVGVADLAGGKPPIALFEGCECRLCRLRAAP